VVLKASIFDRAERVLEIRDVPVNRLDKLINATG
jgi:hypothetical protein